MSISKPIGTVTGWYGGYPVIEPIDGWIPAVGAVLYSAPDADHFRSATEMPVKTYSGGVPNYVWPRKPLTDEQISRIWDSHVVPVFGKNGINPIVFARAIERAHGITE